MKSILPVLLLLSFACTSTQNESAFLPDGIEAVSMLGDTLFTPNNELSEAITSRIDSLIEVAEVEDDQVSITVWNARLQGYRGQYRAAIQTLSQALESELANDDVARATFLRHRGHRYISSRQFDLAISDFEEAARLIEGTEDVVEPDGLPNAMNIPLSSLHTNIWYHLGLAYYLTGQYDLAASAYEKRALISSNDDMRVAALYWQYMALRKQGLDEEAGKLLDEISPEMEIIENNSYHQLLLVFKGHFEADSLLSNSEDALTNATLGYGLGFWHSINDRQERAETIWQEVYDAGNWASFGYIASEVELASK